MAAMPETPRQKSRSAGRVQSTPCVSAVFAEGVLVEMVYTRADNSTGFAVWENSSWRITVRIKDAAGRDLVPYRAENNLLEHGVVLFPSEPVEYGSQDELVDEVRAYIRRYVDVTAVFEQIAAHYVLLTWVHDCFNELPYLRLLGNYGTGKTRFLQIVGSVCYRPIFASGASTVSPIFHMLDSFGGTLILDEADLRFSDEKADMVKILNNGNIRGMPVLRSQLTRRREFEPQVFCVFGPKIVATRGRYEDDALESRFITEQTGQGDLRGDVPINLPMSYEREALALRNKLLMYRFKRHGHVEPHESRRDDSRTPRLNQMLAPLLALVEDASVRDKIRAHTRASDHRARANGRGAADDGKRQAGA